MKSFTPEPQAAQWAWRSQCMSSIIGFSLFECLRLSPCLFFATLSQLIVLVSFPNLLLSKKKNIPCVSVLHSTVGIL